MDELLEGLHILRMLVVACQTLLQLACIKQIVCAHAPAELSNERDMLGNVARQSSELWVLFDEALHVLNAIEFLAVRLLRGKLLDIVFGVLTEVAEVEVHVFGEERILILRENNLLQYRSTYGLFKLLADKQYLEFRPDLGHVTEIHLAILDP